MKILNQLITIKIIFKQFIIPVSKFDLVCVNFKIGKLYIYFPYLGFIIHPYSYFVKIFNKKYSKILRPKIYVILPLFSSIQTYVYFYKKENKITAKYYIYF